MKGEHLTNWQSENCDFAVRRGAMTSGHLVFTSDAAGVTILADPSMPELARGRFAHHLPRIRAEAGGTTGEPTSGITLQDEYIPFISRLVTCQAPLGEVRLNPAIPWEIEFRCAISNLNADLRVLELRSLDLLGAASQIRLLLSRPAKTTFIYIAGGIRKGTIRVPPGVGIRVHFSGGVSNLVFDDHRYDAVSGDTNLVNSTFNSATSQYDICMAGGASDVTIGE